MAGTNVSVRAAFAVTQGILEVPYSTYLSSEDGVAEQEASRPETGHGGKDNKLDA